MRRRERILVSKVQLSQVGASLDARSPITKPVSAGGTGRKRRTFIAAPGSTDGSYAEGGTASAGAAPTDITVGSDSPTRSTPADGAVEVVRRWTITTTNGFTAHGQLPAWAGEDPSREVAPDRLELSISDVHHAWQFDGPEVVSNTASSDGRRIGLDTLLSGQMACIPYSSNPVERVPHVNIETLEGSDEWIEHLDPAGVADLAAKLRVHADRLDEIGRKLTEARADWATHANGSM